MTLYDDDESFTAGDPDPADIDWEAVARLESRMNDVLAVPDDEARAWAMLDLFDELHDGQAEIL